MMFNCARHKPQRKTLDSPAQKSCTMQAEMAWPPNAENQHVYCQIYKLHKRVWRSTALLYRLIIHDMTSATNAGAACTRRPLPSSISSSHPGSPSQRCSVEVVLFLLGHNSTAAQSLLQTPSLSPRTRPCGAPVRIVIPSTRISHVFGSKQI